MTRNRPVPRFLILDQPTQAHYPADDDNDEGQPVDDADRIAVRAMFRLMYDFVVEAAPDFQIIVCDHADLPEDWFQDSVRHRWREGRSEIPALTPVSWLEAPSDSPDEYGRSKWETALATSSRTSGEARAWLQVDLEYRAALNARVYLGGVRHLAGSCLS